MTAYSDVTDSDNSQSDENSRTLSSHLSRHHRRTLNRIETAIYANRRPVDSASAADSDYFGLFNARNAKIIGFMAFLVVLIYHSVLHLMAIRKDACIGLLETGRYQGNHMWQPYGCMIHKYSQADARLCVDAAHQGRQASTESTSRSRSSTWILFAGDGRLRQLYERVVRQFSPELAQTAIESTHQVLTDDFYEERYHRLKLEYRYFQSVNEDMVESFAHLADLVKQSDHPTDFPTLIVLSHGLAPFNQTLPPEPDEDENSDADSKADADTDDSLEDPTSDEKSTVNANDPSPSTMTTSTTQSTTTTEPYSAEKYIRSVLESFQLNMTALVEPLNQLHHNSTVLFMLQPMVDEFRLARDNPNRTWLLDNRHINQANAVVEKTLAYSFVRVWRSASLLSNGHLSESSNGFAIGPMTLDYDMQILLNLHCNDVIRFFDATCCGRTEALTRVQMGAFAVYSVCIAVLLLMFFMRIDVHHISSITSAVENGVAASLSPAFQPKHERHNSRSSPPVASSRKRLFVLMFNLSKLSAIMLFFYMCDRADYFMKENKWFTYFNLFLPIVYLSVIGLFFTEDTSNTEFMSRDQTDEMKGAMQLIILSSHLTGAIEIPWVYMMNRCLLSAYFFLLGYGHFLYFWRTADYSVSRFLRVLFRYNMLVVLLCVTMNRPYQFYSFVPLITFWFIVVYVTMACPPRIHAANCNQSSGSVPYFLMTIKLIVMFSVISVFYLSQIFFDKIVQFGPWRPLFVTDNENGPVHDWWTKWWHDRYSTPFGIVFAFLMTSLRSQGAFNDQGAGHMFSKKLTMALAIFSVMGMMIYFSMVNLCRSQAECNESHPYIVFLPIISYLLLRNLFGCARKRVSHFFAWFGRITIEVFTAQHHIWMVSDSNGVLVLLPRYPVLNVIVTSYIFICVAHELRELTEQLMPFLLPTADTPSSPFIQRIFSLLLLLTFVSISYTYFSRSDLLNTNAL